MKLLKYYSLVVAFLMAGCVSTNSSQVTNTNLKNQKQFTQLLVEFKQSPESVDYQEFWQAYLRSEQTDYMPDKTERYEQIVDRINSGKMSCNDVDWQNITEQNFWSINPHLSAEFCYREMGMLEQAQFHKNTASYIIQNTLESGTGDNYYNAIEVTSWQDAYDIAEFLDYKVVDAYMELMHNDQAAYLIYIVDNIDTGKQKKLYFQNNRYLHTVFGMQYPFAATNNLLNKLIVDSKSIPHDGFKIAKAKTLIKQNKFNDAVQVYYEGAKDNSAVANYFLGLLCYNKDQIVLLPTECLNFIEKASTLGYNNATIALAFIHKEGIHTKKSPELYQHYLQAAQKKNSSSEVWTKLASFYNGAIGLNDPTKRRHYLNKAAQSGSLEAAYTLVMLAIEKIDINNPTELSQLLKQLSEVATRGLDSAQATYADLLIRTRDDTNDAWQSAKPWLENAAGKNNPLAKYLLGQGHYLGYFGEVNLTQAHKYFDEASHNYFAKSQLSLAHLYNSSTSTITNKPLALLWYSQCAQSKLPECMMNVGIFFEQGVIVRKNPRAAYQAYKSAAELGYAPSITRIALMYLNASGIQRDIETGRKLLNKSCKLGDKTACQNLLQHPILN